MDGLQMQQGMPQQIGAQPQSMPPQPMGQGSMGSGPLGSGLANNAAMLTKFREPYMRMATQMAMDGQEPPPFQQWVQTQMPQQQAPQAPMDRRSMLESLVGAVRG
jgi:hypothetical protein